MKKILYSLPLLLILFSCNQGQQSAFTGEVVHTTAPVGTIPEESIYNLTNTFTTQDNQTVELKDFSGKPTLVCMIFTHCDYACPRLTADIKNIEEKLGKDADNVNFLLVSFDVERDTPERLKVYQKDMKLDNRFTLLHGDEDAVRTLSVLINVQYQKNANGDFSHSNVISILDKNGQLIYQKEGIQANHDETISQIKALIKS